MKKRKTDVNHVFLAGVLLGYVLTLENGRTREELNTFFHVKFERRYPNTVKGVEKMRRSFSAAMDLLGSRGEVKVDQKGRIVASFV